jgi:hypothetical protein
MLKKSFKTCRFKATKKLMKGKGKFGHSWPKCA